MSFIEKGKRERLGFGEAGELRVLVVFCLVGFDFLRGPINLDWLPIEVVMMSRQ